MFRQLSEILGDFFRARAYTHQGRVYIRLRNAALSIIRADVGIPTPPPDAPVWGILMDIGFPKLTASVLAVTDGTTSIYKTDGGGIIGGESHESVRVANARFIETANRYRQHLKPSKTSPMPKVGQILFYAQTDSGILAGEGTDEDLPYDRNPLSPLFQAGNEVITQLRLVAERSHDA